MIKGLFSPTVKAAFIFAVGGAAFAVANILLARQLTTEEFGILSLMFAIAMMCIPLGPIGLDSVVLRHRPGPQIKLLGLSMLAGFVGGLCIVSIAVYTYKFESAYALVLVLVILAGSVGRMCASVFQSEKKLLWSLCLAQTQNFSIFAAAVILALTDWMSPVSVLGAYAFHWVIAAIVGWLVLFYYSNIVAVNGWKVPWSEVPALFGYLVSFHLMGQLDKLMIPKLLDIGALATFGILSSLVMAPFKMLQSGVGFTLVPSLRAASDNAERVRILKHEAKVLLTIIVVASIGAFVFVPWIAQVLLLGKYTLGPVLVGSAIIAGVCRVASMFFSSVVTALGTGAHLTTNNRGAWAALVCSVVFGIIGSKGGLAGVILGFSVGFLIRAAIAAHLARDLINFGRDPEVSV